jgi:hypothetical protein
LRKRRQYNESRRFTEWRASLERAKEGAEQSMGILYYFRHFGLLACLAAVLAATRRWSPAIGIVATFGIYGALHASLLAVTLRARQPTGRRLRFVVIAASLSMLSVALGLGASRFIRGSMGMAQLALLLSLSSGIGAATYASLIRRFFGARLTRSAMVTVVLGCVVATLAVLLSGIYLNGGGLWVAVAWWFAFSLGVWFYDGRSAVHRGLLENAGDGTIRPIDETERR